MIILTKEEEQESERRRKSERRKGEIKGRKNNKEGNRIYRKEEFHVKRT